MKQQIISTTHPVDDAGRPLAPATAQPKERERITLPPVTVVDFDPWQDATDPRTLTQEGREAMPAHALAPMAWFALHPSTRARVGGLAIFLLREYPPVAHEGQPGRLKRLTEVQRLVGLALMGAVRPREDIERNGHSPETVAQAARWYATDPTERAAWQRHRDALVSRGGGHQGMDLVKEVLFALDDSRGILGLLREKRQRLDALLGRLEQRLGGGAPA